MTTTPTAPALTTGWESHLPDTDSLCLRWLRHWAAQCAALAHAAGGIVTHDERYLLADHTRPASFFNAAVLLTPPSAPGQLSMLLDEIEARAHVGTGDVYLWSLWPTPDLSRRGWVLDGHPPLMVRPPGPTPAAEGAPPQRVRSAAELARWEAVLVDGYPLTDVELTQPGTLIGPTLLEDERFRFWLSSEHGRPAAISAQFVAHGLASFALGVTLPSARRAGHWSRHARLRLRTEPHRWHAGVFSDDSRPGAERLGFTPIIRHTLWHRPR
jgi:hypothetical protein